MPITGWSTGKIVAITSENTLQISYDGISSGNDVKLPLDSYNFAPYGIYTGGNEWRKFLYYFIDNTAT